MSDFDTTQELLRQKKAHEKFAKRWAKAQDGDNDEKRERLDVEAGEYPLSIEEVRHFEVVFGTGGPHTEVDVTVKGSADDGWYIASMEWGGYWGGTVVKRRVSDDEPLWRLCVNYVEPYLYD